MQDKYPSPKLPFPGEWDGFPVPQTFPRGEGGPPIGGSEEEFGRLTDIRYTLQTFSPVPCDKV